MKAGIVLAFLLCCALPAKGEDYPFRGHSVEDAIHWLYRFYANQRRAGWMCFIIGGNIYNDTIFRGRIEEWPESDNVEDRRDDDPTREWALTQRGRSLDQQLEESWEKTHAKTYGNLPAEKPAQKNRIEIYCETHQCE